jgi:hypothetical protein
MPERPPCQNPPDREGFPRAPGRSRSHRSSSTISDTLVLACPGIGLFNHVEVGHLNTAHARVLLGLGGETVSFKERPRREAHIR